MELPQLGKELCVVKGCAFTEVLYFEITANNNNSNTDIIWLLAIFVAN